VSKAASILAGLAIHRTSRAKRGKIPPSNTNRQPISVSSVSVVRLLFGHGDPEAFLRGDQVVEVLGRVGQVDRGKLVAGSLAS
jgi:hypothetical protein